MLIDNYNWDQDDRLRNICFVSGISNLTTPILSVSCEWVWHVSTIHKLPDQNDRRKEKDLQWMMMMMNLVVVVAAVAAAAAVVVVECLGL